MRGGEEGRRRRGGKQGRRVRGYCGLVSEAWNKAGEEIIREGA